jgi:hypothetical protein
MSLKGSLFTNGGLLMITFPTIRDAIRECTSFDLRKTFDQDDKCYVYELVDPCGDVDGDPFYELDDVLDYACNNADVNDYLDYHFAIS